MSASRACSNRRSRRNTLAACIAGLLGLSASAAVEAATATVTNCSDDVTTLHSLRWAAAQAVNSGDIIDMTQPFTSYAGCTVSSATDPFDETIVLASTVTIHTGVTINGPNTGGAKKLAVSTDSASNTNQRIFYSTGYITINNLGIKYGESTSTAGSAGGNTVYGGCVFARSGITLSGVFLDHCTASATAAGKKAKGGAIAVFDGPITLTDTVIGHSYANSSSGVAYGGAIYGFGDVTLNNSYVSGSANAAAGNAKGGGIAVLPGVVNTYTVALHGSTVQYSFANASGAGTQALGGGIFNGGPVTVDNHSSVRDTAAYQHTDTTGGAAVGGGIYAASDVTLSDGSYLIFNYAKTNGNGKAQGGGIYSAGNVTLNGAVVEVAGARSSRGAAYGGAIFSAGGTVALYSGISVSYADAPASLSQGGGIFAKGGVEFKYGTIAANTADQGGGIALPTGVLYMRGATLYENTASLNASAIAMMSGGATSTAKIINSTISGNAVTGATGKYAVYIKANQTKFYNSTIAYNVGGSGAGVVIAGDSGSTAGLYSTLMSSNSYTNGTQNDFARKTNVTFTANSSNNLIRNPGSAVPNGTLSGTTACPFLHPLKNNGGPTLTHRPAAMLKGITTNPVIDAGSNKKNLATDQRGGSTSATAPLRVSGTQADIGAYEVQQADMIFDTEFETCPN